MKPLREVLPQILGRNQATIRLDEDIAQWFQEQTHDLGNGDYQTLVNSALRQYIEYQKEPLEEKLRRVIRDELQTHRP